MRKKNSRRRRAARRRCGHRILGFDELYCIMDTIINDIARNKLQNRSKVFQILTSMCSCYDEWLQTKPLFAKLIFLTPYDCTPCFFDGTPICIQSLIPDMIAYHVFRFFSTIRISVLTTTRKTCIITFVMHDPVKNLYSFCEIDRTASSFKLIKSGSIQWTQANTFILPVCCKNLSS